MADNISPTDNTDLTDNTSVNDTDNKSTNQYQGVSNPPDEPIETSPDTPTPTNTAQPAIAQPQTPEQTAQQFPFPENRGKEMAQAIDQTPDQKPDYANHPAVQRADLLHTIAQTLAGGPRFQTSIDPDTGHIVHKAVPLSKADIGLAIAAEAIQGSLAGLSVANGPGNLGRAAAAGGAAVMQQRQKVDQQQNDQANADFARHAHVFATNMQMHQNALAVGRQNLESNEKYIGQYKPTVDMLMKDHPEAIRGHATEADLAKYNVTKDTAIPYKTVPRLDPNTGEQVVNSYGEPQWDTDYLIVDPAFKAENLLTEQDKADAAYWRLAGFADRDGKPTDLPKDLPMSLAMSNAITSKLAAGRIAQDTVKNFYDELNTHASGGSQSVFDMFKTTEALADFIEGKEGSKPTDRSKRNHNAGNLIADASWKGPVDSSNLAPEQNGVGYRIYGSDQEGKDALINQLNIMKARTPNATPEEFFKKWDTTNPTAYAAAARQAAGVQAPVDAGNPQEPVDVREAIHNDPKLLDALLKFNPLLEAAKGNYEIAIGNLGKQDPQAAGKMINLLGSSKNIETYDRKRALDAEAAKTAQKNAEAVAQARAMTPIKAEQAAAEETARMTAKNAVADKQLHDSMNQAAGETPDASGMRNNFLSSLGPDEQNELKALASGAKTLQQMGLSGRPAQMKISAELQSAFPGFSQQTVNNYYKVADDVTRRKPMDNANTAMEHLGEMFDAAQRAGYGGTMFGRLTRNISSAQQKQATIDYEQAKARAGQEIEAAYKGAGLTDKDAAHQAELFMAATPDTAQDIVRSASKLLTAKYNSVDHRLASVMPSSETPVQDLMSDAAHAAYKLIHGQDYDSTAEQKKLKTDYGTWYGRSVLDTKRSQSAQANGQNQPQKGQPNPQPGEQPVYVNGQFYGYTQDGKTISRLP